MILAAVGFGDPLMLAGLMAALVPVVLHLLNRMKAPVMAFPTLRFLKITAHKTARRRQIQQYFLLLVRVIVFALVAMAVAGPLIRGGSAMLAYGMVGMLLVGLGLLVVAGIGAATAWEAGPRAVAKPVAAAAGAARGGRAAVKVFSPAAQDGGREGRKRRAGPAFLSVVAGIVAVAMLAYAGHGLASDRYFSHEAPGEFSGRSTALVVILDNSHSMLVREENLTRLQRAKEEVRRLLGEPIRPAEAAILPTNPGPQPQAAALTGDMTRLLGTLDGLTAEGSARPMQERIRTALEMLKASTQPNKLLVIAGDFTRSAFSDTEVFAGLKGLPWRKDLQVVLMPIRAGHEAKRAAEAGARGETGGDPATEHNAPADVGVASFALAEGSVRPVIGAELTFEAQLVNNGDAAEVREFALTVDGNVVAADAAAGSGGGPATRPAMKTYRVQLGAAGTPSARASLRIPYRLAQAGWHRFGVQMQNAQDAMAWDDQRELALEVAEQIKVLVIGAEATNAGRAAAPRARSAAFYFEAALAPFGPAGNAGAAAAGAVPWSIAPTYKGVDQVTGPTALNGYAAVFMCDVPRVGAPLADALNRYVRGGGRVVWVLGPSVDAAAYNDVLLGNGRELLPAPLGNPLVTATASPVEWVDMHSGVFMNLFDNQEPFRSVLVTGRWSFAGDAREAAGAAGKVLAKLPDGVPLIAEHRVRGALNGGRIYTLLTTPAAAWSNLGATVVLVPVASRMALGDFGEGGAENPGSVEAGHGVVLSLPGLQNGTGPAAAGGVSLDVTTPDHAVINARAMASTGAADTPAGGTAAWQFEQTFGEGVYRWKTSDNVHEGMFVVNPPGEEAELLEADVGALAKESSPGMTAAGRPTIVAGGTSDLLAQLERHGEGTSLAPGFLAMVLMLAVIEAMMANRYRPAAG